MKHHLSTLSVLHYVYGVLLCLCGFALLSLVFAASFLNSPWFAQHSGEAPPVWLGSFLYALGWGLFVLVEAHGILNLISARMIDKRKSRSFTQVIAALNCLNIPFGIALGIFTFVVLGNKDVRTEYGLVA
ncbi:MAG: hypothetical protein IPO60_10965 [Flavobacteriales bacterium]|jgi:hypothetical protein|nr:hypothetical protein [Flavobacteriales bacterium]MBK6891932.1 hypothetical protein [Flavobacteriales bacterium]MBK7246069.1 hypothetical protein [Flavobacteriales bacterium]MBK7287891.1 hypothetical protein [Flavobacteriales bacterium]MBK9060163.1 hypothetical protein [Flavobacteriales bacterium]